jgi:hypothetical protein
MLEIGARSAVAIAMSVAGATILAYILYRRTSPTLPLRSRVILGILRWAAALMILLLVTDPVVRLMRIEHRKPVIAVMLDTSRSMAYPESAMKMEHMNSALSTSALEILDKKADVHIFSFSDRTVEIPAADIPGLEARGSRTDLVGGITDVLQSLDGKPSAFIVFSDGGVNFGDDAVHYAGSTRIPIHSVSLAPADPTPDISVDRVEASDLAYANSDFPVWINISGRHGGDIETELTLSDSTGTILTQSVSVSGAGATNRLKFSVDAGDVGIHRFRVDVAPFEGESVLANNSATFTLKVVKGKVRVCLVAPHPSWDFAFARRCLEGAPNVDVSVVFTAGATVRPRLDGAVEHLGRVLPELDVLVVLKGADLNSQIEDIRGFVSRGGGVLLLSAGSGDETLAELSPFTFSAAPRSEAVLYSPVVTDGGRDHEIMALEGDGAGGVWTSLPPVPIDTRTAGVRDESAVLLAGRNQRESLPLLAAMRFGTGRVVGLSAYDLWRWDFVPKGFGVESSVFSGLLLNSVGWLTRREEMRHLSLSTSKSTYAWGEPVDIFARVTDDNLKPLAGALVECEISDPVSGELVRSHSLSDRGGGSHSVRADLLGPGRYLVQATAHLAGDALAEEALEFIIDEKGLEDLNFDGDNRLLEAISSASGGMAHRIEDTAAMLGGINPGTVVHRSHNEFSFKLSLASFVLLVGILGIEWLIRKRKLLI